MDIPSILFIASAVLTAWLFGHMMGRSRSVKPHREDGRQQEALISARKEVAYLQLEHERMRRLFLSLPELVQDLTVSRDPRQIPPILTRAAKQLLSAVRVAYFLRAAAEEAFECVDGHGLPTASPTTLRFRSGEGYLGWIAVHRRPMACRDFEQLSPLEAAHLARATADSPALFGLPCPDLAVPIVGSSGVMGVLAAWEIEGDPEANKLLLTTLCRLGAASLENVSQMGRFQEVADMDGLTGLFNKRYFDKRFTDEVIKAVNYQTPLSIFLLDLDHFKHYNDANGHPAGDTLLKKLSTLVKGLIRRTDFVCRVGGEEFAIVMPGATKEEALFKGDQIRMAIAETKFDAGDRQPLGKVTISGGVASFPQDADTTRELLESADRALYEAKAKGRNLVVSYHSRPLTSRTPGS